MIEYTRLRLSQWGRWCRGREVTGYPTAAAFTHANEGDRARYDGSDFPPDIAEIDQLVCRMSWTMRQPLFAYYIWQGPVWLRAAKACCSRRTMMRRVRTAEEWIDRRLTAE